MLRLGVACCALWSGVLVDSCRAQAQAQALAGLGRAHVGARVGGPGVGVRVERHRRLEGGGPRVEGHRLGGGGHGHGGARDVRRRLRGGHALHLRRRRRLLLRGGLLVALVVHQRAHHQHDEAHRLQPGVGSDALAEAELREAIEEDEVHRPHKDGTHGLEDGAEDGAKVAGDAHAGKVVHHHGEHLRQAQHQDRAVLEKLQRVQRVLLTAAHVGAGKEVHGGQDHERHQQRAVQPLQPHNRHGLHVEVGQEVVLEGDLARLHHLREDDQPHAHDHRVHRFALLAAAAAEDGGHADTCNTGDVEADAHEVDPIQLALEEDNGEDCGEHELGSTKHLVDRGGDGDQSEVHEHRGDEVSQRGGNHNERLHGEAGLGVRIS
mmetsp:Transcript_38230/g.83161  ORF Transcript_38230/g.83161 Transcript_38230/m.83161 type:complete len:378 (+) Transcript_38230:4451-5584(+)